MKPTSPPKPGQRVQDRQSQDLLQGTEGQAAHDRSEDKGSMNDHTIMHTRSYSYDRSLAELDTSTSEQSVSERIRGKGWFRLKMVIICLIGGLALAVAGDLVNLTVNLAIYSSGLHP